MIDGCWDTAFGPKTKLLLVDALMEMTLSGLHNENALRSVSNDQNLWMTLGLVT